MIALAMILGLAVIVSLLSTTAEARAEARQRLARHNWKFAIGTAILWLLMLYHPPP